MAIDSVTVWSRSRRRDVVDYPFTGVLYFGFVTYDVTYYQTQTLPDNTDYANYSNTWTTNPNTGVAWTQTEIDALVGYLAQQGRNASGYRSGGHTTQFYIVVAYSGGNITKRPLSSTDGAVPFDISGAATNWECVDEETPDGDTTNGYHWGTTGSSSTASVTYGLTTPTAPSDFIPKIFYF